MKSELKIKFLIQKRGRAKEQIFVKYHFGKRYMYSLGMSIDAKIWDFEKGRVKSQATNASFINSKLDEIRSQISRYYHGCMYNNESFDNDYIKSEIQNGNYNFKNSGSKVVDEWYKFIDKREEEKIVTSTTSKRHRTVVRILEEFIIENGESGQLLSVDDNYLHRLFRYMVEIRNNNDNSAKKSIEYFKAFLNHCLKNKKIKDDSFLNYKTKGYEPVRYVLTEDELKEVREYDFSHLPESTKDKFENVRANFMIQCYYGRRVSELRSMYSNLDRIDLKNKKIGLRPQKTTNKWVTFQIFDEVLPYIEGIINNKYRLYSDQKYNKYLKEMAKIIGLDRKVISSKLVLGQIVEETKELWEVMSSHIARSTCVTILIKKKVGLENIMLLTGISKYSTIRIYERIADNEASEAISKAWSEI